MSTPAKFKFWDTLKKEWVEPIGRLESQWETLRFEYELFVNRLGQTVQVHYVEYEGGQAELMPHILPVEWTGYKDFYQNDLAKDRDGNKYNIVRIEFIFYFQNVNSGGLYDLHEVASYPGFKILGSSLSHPELLESTNENN